MLTLAALIGPAIVLVSLPGLWLLTLATLLVNVSGALLGYWVLGDPIVSWWIFGIILGSTLISDVVDWSAGVVGAKRMGGTRRAMIAAFLGGIVGAIAGTMVLPIVGTLLGGAVGAGLCATLVHRTGPEETWKQSAKVGAGASAGWFAAILVKLTLAIICATLLIIAAWSTW
ncbi:MAG: DUF456 domain-containing protein [Phycisphaera sp.]|nr:MAG: DUF456 domain-containing protein [Phycisphaera sp.]